MNAIVKSLAALVGRIARFRRTFQRLPTTQEGQPEISERFEQSKRELRAAALEVKRQHARDTLRLKIAILSARFQDQEERVAELRRIVGRHPGFEDRNINQVDRYFSKLYANKTKIQAEVRRLVDFPEAVVLRDGEPEKIKLRRRGWMPYPDFVRAVEQGKIPVYTIRRLSSDGTDKKVPVLVPWAAVVEEMMGFSRHQVEYLKSGAS